MSRWACFLNFILPPSCIFRKYVQPNIIQKRWRFLVYLASSKNYFQRYANSRNYTFSGNWHAARVLIWLVSIPLEMYELFHVIESNQLLLKISSDMPIGQINTLAGCQLLLKNFQQQANCYQMSNFNNWHAAKTYFFRGCQRNKKRHHFCIIFR